MSLFYQWRSMPFLRILWPFILGIILQDVLQISPHVLLPIIVASIGMAMFSRKHSIQTAFKWRVGHTIYLHGILIVLGMFFYVLKEEQQHPQWFGKHYQLQDQLIIKIDAAFVEKNKTFQSQGLVEGILRNGRFIPVKGKLLIYFRKGRYINALQFGDRLKIDAPPEALQNSGNPGSFAVADYYARQQLFHQAFIAQKNILHIERPCKTPWQWYLIRSRTWIVQKLERYLSAPESGLAAAMLIGYKDALEPQLYQSYVNTGVVHVIAISGMHLGLIYTLLRLLTSWMPQRRNGRLLRGGLQLTGIWLFALLTGAGPSIIRAAVMFSCHIIGQLQHKKSASLNNLCAAAFLLLCYQPQWLWDAGFLLSFLALAGIFLLQHPLNAIYPKRPSWIDGIWKFNSVTIAAQLFTTPISLYFFHQFPIYFLCSNMLAVPLSTGILLLSIAVCVTSPIQPLAVLLGNLTVWLIRILNAILNTIAHWPYALWDGWQLSVVQVVVCYASIAFVYLHMRTADRRFRSAAGFSCVVLFLMNAIALMTSAHQERIIVYQVKKHTAMAWLRGRTALFLMDPLLMEDSTTLERAILPSKTYFHLRRYSMQVWKGETCLLEYEGLRICIAGKAAVQLLQKPVTILLITRQTASNLMDMMPTKDIKQIICDPTVSKQAQQRWQCFAKRQHIPYFSVYHEGAFVKTLP